LRQDARVRVEAGKLAPRANLELARVLLAREADLGRAVQTRDELKLRLLSSLDLDAALLPGLQLDGQSVSPNVAATTVDEALSQRIEAACRQAFEGMNDDLNTAVALAGLFELLKVINSLRGGQIAWETLEASAFEKMKSTYLLFVEEILGLREEPGKSSSPMHTMMETVLEAYRNAKDRKDYALVDAIRANVKKEGIVIRDAKTGISWDYEE